MKTKPMTGKTTTMIMTGGLLFRYEMPTHEAKDYAKSFRKAARVTKQRLDHLAAAIEAGDDEERDKLVHELLTTKKSKIAGVMRYAARQSLDDRPTLDECVKCTQRLDLTKPIKEPARAYALKKPGKDGWRPIADFKIQHRTAQHMVKAILGRVFVPQEFQ